MLTGRVKWFNQKKGHGFITADGGVDIFVHYSAVAGEGYKVLYPGQRVEYELVETTYGTQSKNVKVIENNDDV